MKTLLKPFFELMLECEMDQHLGYSKHETRPQEAGENYRNGRTSKRVRGDFGELTVEAQRDTRG